MIRREDKEISNEHPLAKKAEVERIELASMKGPPVPIDIGKILLLKRLVREGKFKEIRKLKLLKTDYGTHADYMRTDVVTESIATTVGTAS